jgi:hypothetical protein
VNNHLARFLAAGSLLGIAALAGCAGSNQSAVPPQLAMTQPQSIIMPHPAACLAEVSKPIHAAGGTIALPACDTFGGTIGYPPNNAPAGTTTDLESYQTDPGGGTGNPGVGTVIAWVRSNGESTAGSVVFNSMPVKTATLFGSPVELPTGHTYTLYVYAFGIQQGSEALGSPVCTMARCTLTFPSPLTGMTVPQGIDLFFELDEM